MNYTLAKNPTRFLIRFLRPHLAYVFTLVSLSTLAGFWGPLHSLLIKHTIDSLTQPGSDTHTFLSMVPFLLVFNFLIFDNVTWRTIRWMQSICVPRILNAMLASLLDTTLRQSHQYFQDHLAGKITRQMGHVVDSTEKLITTVTANFCRGLSMLLVALVFTGFVHPIFSLIMAVWFALFALLSYWMSRGFLDFSAHQSEKEARVMGEFVDVVTNQASVRLFSGADREASRMRPYYKAQEKAYAQTHQYAVWTDSIQGGLIALMMGCCAYVLLILYQQHIVSVGDFALIFGITMETGHSMWFTMSQIDEGMQSFGKLRQSLTFLRSAPTIQDTPQAVPLSVTQGSICFHRVTFQYPGTSPLFQKTSLTIKPGQKVGLVGYSGSGKTTFVHLLLRLYEIDQGQITIDGQNIQECTQESLHASIATIPQDPSLFHRTLFENIAYARPDAGHKEVFEAARHADAHEFIERIEGGYEAIVGERGLKLSGGQRQRIAMARAMLKNAPILILDEATSQLDSATEQTIQKNLWKFMKGRTTLVIAHRLATLLEMDRILVFDQGNIVADGTHTSLLQTNPLYQKLWSAQVGGFLGDGAQKT